MSKATRNGSKAGLQHDVTASQPQTDGGENNAAHSDHTGRGWRRNKQFSIAPAMHCSKGQSSAMNWNEVVELQRAPCLMIIQWIAWRETYSCESIVFVGAHCIYCECECECVCVCMCMARPGHLECTWAADHWHFHRCQDTGYVYFGPSLFRSLCCSRHWIRSWRSTPMTQKPGVLINPVR